MSTTDDVQQPTAKYSARELAEALQQFAPTEEQAAIIESPQGPLLVVAGAGAGKTETMAARVVWLVANGFCRPSEVLGLTFTRKAAQQLASRIRARLRTLAGTPLIRDLDPSGELQTLVESESPTVLTYDAYAGHLVREYGLLLPVEPSARMIQQTEYYQLIDRVLSDYPHTFTDDNSRETWLERVYNLSDEMDSHLISVEDLRGANADFQKFLDGVAAADGGVLKNDTIRDAVKATTQREELINLVERLWAEMDARHLTTFGRQMFAAARLAQQYPVVRKGERNRFKVVMLDEYQDTSHSQRILLSKLFAGKDSDADTPTTITAVGDPMQAIYGWRGATANNLLCFLNDFAVDGKPAEKKELIRSWRNPKLVLQLANMVSDDLLNVEGSERPVQPLEPRPDAASGDVNLAWFPTPQQEIAYVADYMADLYREKKSQGKKFTGAILVRNNSHSRPIEVALAQRGIPFETGSLNGLLNIPEVADVVAVATMLVNPAADASALRILAGPHVGLGVADIKALAKRAKSLNRQSQPKSEDAPIETDAVEVSVGSDPAMDKLREIIAETTAIDAVDSARLVDAIADLGPADNYSEEGYERLKRLSAELRYLRTHCLNSPLPELFMEIQRVIGLRAEVEARLQDRSGTAHLDRLQEEVENYVNGADALGEQASLGGLLRFFGAAETFDKGLEPGEVSVQSNRVQILTAHKAKGLEWDAVAVMHCSNNIWAKDKASQWLTNASLLPAHLRGDAEKTTGVGIAIPNYPTPDLTGVVKAANLNKAKEAYSAALRAHKNREEERLFYVAMTRTERALLLTGSSLREGAIYGTDSQGLLPVYSPFEELKNYVASTHPECIATWTELKNFSDLQLPEGYAIDGTFPSLNPTDGVLAGAATVRSMLDESANTKDLPEADNSSELAGLWEQEVNALIEEHLNNQRDTLEVPLIDELTASDMVALKANPDDFTRRLIRPVPFKPNRYAKRGTAFHLWLEQRFAGDIPLFDEDEILGMGEGDMEPEKLEQLKENYLASPWAQRTPEYVEHPFEVRIGRNVMRGRIDAIFRDEETGGWLVLDWKTGRVPEGAQMAAAEYQLAVYAAAWKEWINDGAPIRAAFHYVAKDYTHYVNDVPTKEDLVDFLHNTVLGKPRTLVDEETPEPEAEEN